MEARRRLDRATTHQHIELVRKARTRRSWMREGVPRRLTATPEANGAGEGPPTFLYGIDYIIVVGIEMATIPPKIPPYGAR